MQGGRKARGGANDAHLGGHFYFAKEFFADALHVEVNGAGGFADKFDSAEFESFEGAGCAFARFGADDDNGPRVGGHDLRRSLQTVHVRHVDVHRDDIGPERFSQRDGFAAVLGMTSNLELRVAVENRFKDFAHEGRIIHDEHARFVGGRRHGWFGRVRQPAEPPPFR